MVHDSCLVPSNPDHCLLSEAIYWCFVKTKLQFLAFEIPKIYPFLMASNGSILPFIPQKLNFESGSSILDLLSVNSCDTHFPTFWFECSLFSLLLKRSNQFLQVVLGDPRSLYAFSSERYASVAFFIAKAEKLSFPKMPFSRQESQHLSMFQKNIFVL